jgi:hypothetical protein
MQTEAATPKRERRIRRVISLRERRIDAAIRQLEWLHRIRREIRCYPPIPFPGSL